MNIFTSQKLYMNNFFFLHLFTLLFFFTGQAQSVEMDGKVTNELNQPVSNANIVIKSLTTGSVLKYGTTNDEGYFKLKFTTADSKIQIKTSHVYYQSITDSISVRQRISYAVVLKESSTSLKEIVVASKKVKDTMKIKTDSMGLTQRSTLRDILNKTEGFHVSDEGGISFRGKQINKVLINKKEVFINQNKVALDNLDYQVMSNLELINNYRDRFNVSFDSNVESVINVNTKKEFKGVLKTTVEGAYGIRDKYTGKVKGMFFSDFLNAFVTSNTNNIGKKDFSFNDVSAAFKSRSSSLFKENFSSFFSEDDLLKKSFDSNSSLTFRKESRNDKIGFVAYFNRLDLLKRNLGTTANKENEKIKEEILQTNSRGSSFLANFILNHRFDSNTTFYFLSDIAYSSQLRSGLNTVINYYPSMDIVNEKKSLDNRSFLLSNELSLKRRMNENTIFVVGIQNNLEKTKQNFESEYFITNSSILSQEFSFSNNYLKFFSELNRRINQYSHLSTRFTSTIGDELLTEKVQRKRQIITNEAILEYNYNKNNTFETFLQVVPKMYTIESGGESKNSYLLQLKGSTSYHLSQSKILRLEYGQNNNYIDLYKSIDTLMLSFNNRLVTASPLTHTITKQREVGLGYYYSSIIKGKSFSLSTSLSENRNYLQPILKSIINNVFYYNNQLLDKKQDFAFYMGAGKKYYLTKGYHLVSMNGAYTYNWSKMPTLIDDSPKRYFVENQGFSASFGFEPKKVFFTKMAFSAKLNKQKMFLEDTRLNSFNTIIYEFGIYRKKEHFDFDLILGKKVNETKEFSFDTPFLNINSNVKLTEKMDVFLKSRYLFHLFKMPNTDKTNLNIFSEGNLISQNYNQDILNYLLLGLSYKF